MFALCHLYIFFKQLLRFLALCLQVFAQHPNALPHGNIRVHRPQ
jgi:hypothetical protein